jgi:hypothetical protein
MKVMNAQQINKSRMFYAATQVLDDNQSRFGHMAELAAAHLQLKGKMILINQHRQVQVVDNTGLTRNKETLREELTILLLRISVGLTAHAAATGDQVLQAKAEYSLSDLKKSSDRILCDIAVLINSLAATFAVALPTYFVGPEELAQFDRLTNEFKSVLPLRRAAASVSKVSTSNINEVIHEIDALLKNKIDLLIKPFRFTQPDFYKAYKNSRTIVNYSGRGKAAATV